MASKPKGVIGTQPGGKLVKENSPKRQKQLAKQLRGKVNKKGRK